MLPLGCRRHLGLETPFWYNCHMAVLNLRGVPDELAQRLKADAALAGVSLRDYCVRLLSGRGVEGHAAGGNESQVVASARERCAPRIASSHTQARKAKPQQQVSSPAAPTKPCDDCGALIGHQKWCKSRR